MSEAVRDRIGGLLKEKYEVYPDSAEIRKNPLPTAVGAILVHP